MAATGDLIDFSVIEDHKENIQSLPGGRSARTLASVVAPLQQRNSPSLSDTQNLKESVKQEYEKELEAIDEADDPLDIYDRYVKWTMDAYPAAQATAESSLLPLLERATKAFLNSSHYKNDPRYLKLWLLYIRFFSDSPRETFAFLARNNIGEGLALFYEEYAGWLEGAGRWTQAEEVFSTGIDREARPSERLIRKFAEFQHRRDTKAQESDGPTSPALPKSRPALAAKVDPFASATPAEDDPQERDRAAAAAAPKTSRKKLAIFSDSTDAPTPGAVDGGQVWGHIGSLKDRKKENMREARPLAGSTLDGGRRIGSGSKMLVYKDETVGTSNEDKWATQIHADRVIVNPRTGRKEYVFSALELVYPDGYEDESNIEYCFEELRAKSRGWLDIDWNERRAAVPDVPQETPVEVEEEAPDEVHEEAPDEVQEEAPDEVQEEAPKADEVHMDAPMGKLSVFQDALVDVPTKISVFREESAPPTLSDNVRSPLAAFGSDKNGRRPPKAEKIAVLRDSPSRASENPFPEPLQASLQPQGGQPLKSRSIAVLRDAPIVDDIGPRHPVSQGSKVPLLPADDENDENAIHTPKDVLAPKKPRKLHREDRANRTRKIKVTEIHSATETVKANLASPMGPKKKLKKSSEPTMTVTIHTKEAMSEIYDIFNQPLKSQAEAEKTEDDDEDESEDESEEEEEDDDEDDYTSGGESTTTGRIFAASEYGDTTTGFTANGVALDVTLGDDTAWSDPTELKHLNLGGKSSNAEDSDEASNASDDDATGETAGELTGDHTGERTSSSAASVEHGNDTASSIPESADGPQVPALPIRQKGPNRLPFMTPIVERTESSIGAMTAFAEKEHVGMKTPSRENNAHAPSIESGEEDPWSSPFQDMLKEAENKENARRVLQAKGSPNKPRSPLKTKKSNLLHGRDVVTEKVNRGPIIQDIRCNPLEEGIRSTILTQVQPPLASYNGYFDRRGTSLGRSADIRKYAKAVAKSGKQSSEKTLSSLAIAPVICLEGARREYTVRRELGRGAFAPVYLADSSEPSDEAADDVARMGEGAFGVTRGTQEALKMEDPPSAWEFYIIRQAKRRLGVSRPCESIVNVHEMHLYDDECYLIEDYRNQGTLLDLINICRADAAGGGAMDEQLAMFFTIELFRTMEALHAKGLIHGDIKPDNVLVRFETLPSENAWTAQYRRDGTGGWCQKGVMLIDFGRGIDMKVFKPEAQFIADWKTSEADCAEMREMRPWTFQVDYHGLAGVVHSLLFGKYLETASERSATLGAGATKTYRTRESLKRYWQTEIWGEVFNLLLNPLMHLEREEERKLPVVTGMRMLREQMEQYLEANSEKGAGLKALLRRMETAVRERRR
ncbi:hypothetical protein EJ06DRAFT_528412 [Trichodelitschia bisporula]|uniref:Uncharacterized protein n=1 Tax=Trichodelitschia bisporula TaxID=703511 RepID=A0A6G1I289_9PEZI|nr:hypothetical protein EJ06DRAFT_528412 [Trichodelitschia bisporula]